MTNPEEQWDWAFAGSEPGDGANHDIPHGGSVDSRAASTAELDPAACTHRRQSDQEHATTEPANFPKAESKRVDWAGGDDLTQLRRAHERCRAVIANKGLSWRERERASEMLKATSLKELEAIREAWADLAAQLQAMVG